MYSKWLQNQINKHSAFQISSHFPENESGSNANPSRKKLVLFQKKNPTMAAEIDLLVNNFKQLWQSGRSAHLDMETHAGQAWIGLRVRLGHPGVPHHQQQGHSKRGARNSPSKQRRRIRRAAA